MALLLADNSFCYIAALAAGAELATQSGDVETATTAKAAQTKGVAAIKKLLWQPDGGFFTSFWCDEKKVPGFAAHNYALQSSVLYGKYL